MFVLFEQETWSWECVSGAGFVSTPFFLCGVFFVFLPCLFLL